MTNAELVLVESTEGPTFCSEEGVLFYPLNSSEPYEDDTIFVYGHSRHLNELTEGF